MPSLLRMCPAILLMLPLLTNSAEGENNEKVVFCIFVPSIFILNLDLSSFQPNLCTHLLFTSGKINIDNELQFNSMSERFNHYDNLRKLKDLKRINPRLKMTELISTSRNFPKSSAGRRRFILSVVKYLSENDMDGISIVGTFCLPLDVESPVELKTHIVLLVEELSEELKDIGKELIVSLAASKSPNAVDKCFDVIPLAEKADYIELNFSQFDLFDNKTYFAAPLYSTGDTSIADVVNSVLKKGVPARKVVMGLPTQGRKAALKNVSADGKISRYDPELPTIAFHNICRILNLEPTSKQWVKYWDDISASPYAMNGSDIMAYDDVRSYTEKVKFAERKRLGGVSIHNGEKDDPEGICYGEAFPLLRAAHRAIGRTLVTNITVQTTDL